MRRKSKLAGILIIVILLLLLVQPALAGGWVVITLDGLPGPIHAGETVNLGFMVRQHGERPLNDVSPRLSAVNRESGETITVDAEQVGETGHFQVAVVFPSAGAWDWQLSAPPFPQQVEFEPLTVLPAASGETTTPSLSASTLASNVRAAMRWSGAGLLGLAGLLALAALVGQRRRQKEAAKGALA